MLKNNPPKKSPENVIGKLPEQASESSHETVDDMTGHVQNGAANADVLCKTDDEAKAGDEAESDIDVI